ncbi:hypothetical protein ScPMuIL_007390 [Solemya velum]
METEDGNKSVQDEQGLIHSDSVITADEGTILLVDLVDGNHFIEHATLQTEQNVLHLADSCMQTNDVENTPVLPNEIDVSEVVVEIGSQIAVPPEGQADVLLPAEVGAETVIQTTSDGHTRKTKPKSWLQAGRLGHGSDSDVLGGPDGLIESSIWSALEFQKTESVGLTEGDFSHQESFVALVPEHSQSRENIKKQKDKMKKRELRSNPNYWEKEKEKAKTRMKSRRDDPSYRAIEREKDRERRKSARQRNNEVRQRERERDRLYKRLQRTRTQITMSNLEDFSSLEDKSLVSSLVCDLSPDKMQPKGSPVTDSCSASGKLPVFIFSAFEG